MKLFFGGGLNEQLQPNINEAAKGSYNFELRNDTNALIPRAPFDLKGTATNAGDIRGILQLIKKSDDSDSTLVQAGNIVYHWNGGNAFTSVATCDGTSQLRDCYWALDDYIVVTDLQKATPVSKWDGTTFSTLTTGLGATLYAKYAIVRDGRVWLFNVKTSTDTPHLIAVSAFENPTSYDITQRAVSGTFSTGLEAFYILTPDLRGVNGVAMTVAGDLIVSTVEGRLFKLTGSSAKTYAFENFYPASNAVGTEAMVGTGNDVMYMRKGGNIDSLIATQNYGDVASDDLSRWIRTSVEGLADAIAVYDQSLQKVLWFVTNKILVLFKDILYGGGIVGQAGERAKLSPWSVYRTEYGNNFTTHAAKYMRIPGSTTYSVYFGDSSGRIFDLNGTGTSGDGGTTDISTVRISRLITEADGVKMTNHVPRGIVQYRRLNQVSFSVTLDFADDYTSSAANIVLKGPPAGDAGTYFGGNAYYGGDFYYAEGFTFSDRISHQNFSCVGSGPGYTVTCTASTSKSFQVDNVEIS